MTEEIEKSKMIEEKTTPDVCSSELREENKKLQLKLEIAMKALNEYAEEPSIVWCGNTQYVAQQAIKEIEKENA